MNSELITEKRSVNYPSLFVRKYKKKVFYKNLWGEDPLLLESRGHIVNESGSLVVNPLTKIFNYQENNTTIPMDESVLVVEKINGFMASVTYVPELGKAIVSTTGSLDSEYVDLATEMLPYAIEFIEKHKKEITYVFEIVHPDDTHIIKENIGAYLVARREVCDKTPYFTNYSSEQILDKLAKMMRVSRPNYYRSTFFKVVNISKTCRHEGFVVYGKTTVLKIKSPYYLALKAYARRKDILSLDKTKVDEEYYELVEHLTTNKEQFLSLKEQERLEYMKNFLHRS